MTSVRLRTVAQRAVSFSLTLILLVAAAAGYAREVTDMTGRKVRVPNTINKIYCTSQLGTVFFYTLAPETLAGWSNDLSPDARKYLAKRYADLPNIGGWYSQQAPSNSENLLKAGPDVIVSMGEINHTAISTSERLQQQTGIPLLMVTGHLTDLDQSYEYAAALLGIPDRARPLAAYCKATVTEIQMKTKRLTANQRCRVYLAEGPRGLDTITSGSIHAELLDFVGGINVAAMRAKGFGGGKVSISMEQLLAWNPDVIVVVGDFTAQADGFGSIMKRDPAWNRLKAVREGRVYEVPQYPFNWFGRPPSVNRLIGAKWLAQCLYPQLVNYDLAKETRAFYKLFYHRELSDSEIMELLGKAIQ
jgi:iron complex transport system substrate-binding protein